ncbi:MAG: 50S ribosomal protein L24 [Proteocatella sp.]|nr:50S ribosomal protein L24 [Proteocatella sp.]MBP9966159.1 50S ribosomal protein L24 [Proteocatella sp.]
MRIKSGDTVVIISGKDKGKKGKVMQVFPKAEKVLVEGVNVVTKHQKPSKDHPQGGLIKKESAIHCSNVMPYDSKAGKGVRVSYKEMNGKKVRVSKKTGEQI